MKFSVSIPAVMRGDKLTTADKIRRAGAIGYRAYEMWGWWDEDLDAVRQAADEYGMEAGSICTRFVPLVDPSRRTEYIAGLKESVEAAKRLGCRYLISQAGNALEGASHESQAASLVEGLRLSAPILEQSDITLVLEPLNTRVDHPGYFLEKAEEGAWLVRAVGSRSVKLLYDVYHQQITEGNLIPTIKSNMDVIDYFHIADHPGRHEIGTGEIHYANVLRAVKSTGYDGFVGLEYFPSADAEETLRRFLEEFGHLA
ncbi:hydroxypyruvate isomerase family protein [Paenibacillus humicola]|uniref:hydroxypyruvate isomerase family protein n=1 Tax=Paenibacillus humicola TaxID=3110540 RepID=UPI00237C448D|nr:TIM barrel protein [Paenibacillus humicola]